MKATRDGFGQQLYTLISERPDLVVLTADLGDSLRLEAIRRDFPAQLVELGISEQNMAGVAAGMALAGKTVVITSFAVFNPGRNWEQIRVSICEQNLNVKIVGAHAGLTAGGDGGTHQALEDLALMTALPRMRVLVPADEAQAQAATRLAVETAGPVYLRLTREPMPDLPIPTGQPPLAWGQGQILRPGTDAVIIACGLSVFPALAVAEQLQADADLAIGVVNFPSLSPLDHQLLRRLAREAQALITVEEHQLTGGLGSLVASSLAASEPTIIEMVGVKGEFGQSGTREQLWGRYGLDETAIKEAVLRAIERKVAQQAESD